MRIVALVKSVPDTEAKIKINADASGIETAGVKYVMNTYDEYAVEEGLQIREKTGDATVTAMALGPDRVVEVLRTALAMGADEAVHVSDPELEGGDAQGNARALAAAIEKTGGADLILCGKQGIDFDLATTGPAIAEFLGVPQALIVTDLTLADDKQSVTALRRIEGGDEVVEMTLPALVSCEKGLNEPRYASLPGIMKAKKKEIKVLSLGDLGLDAAQVGSGGVQNRLVKYHPLPERAAVKMIDGEPDDQAKELVRLLREEAKVV